MLGGGGCAEHAMVDQHIHRKGAFFMSERKQGKAIRISGPEPGGIRGCAPVDIRATAGVPVNAQ